MVTNGNKSNKPENSTSRPCDKCHKPALTMLEEGKWLCRRCSRLGDDEFVRRVMKLYE